MNAPRFFVDAEPQIGMPLALPAAVVHHALRVLRLVDGEAIRLFNGRGGEFAARLRVAGRGALAEVEAFDPIERESPLSITLIQAMTGGDKLDWVIEKATELGAARLVLAATARSIARPRGERLQRKLSHWRDVAIAACCQCGRNRLPQIDAAASLRDALDFARAASTRLILDVAAEAGWPAAIPDPVALLIGPEGGWTEEERAAARAHRFVALRFGPRTLRTETAGLAAIAALQARAGDCG